MPGLGAFNDIPVIPTFTQGAAPSLADLQELSYAVNFVATCNVRPTWHYFNSSNQAISAGSWQDVVGPNTDAVYDCDSTFTNGNFVAFIVTTGYYRVEACIAIEGSATMMNFRTAFLWEAGTKNPHYAQGTTKRFGMRAGASSGSAGRDSVFTPSEACPVVCYPNDSIVPQIYTSAAATVDYNVSGGSGYESRFSCNFTGYLIRTGT